MLYMLDPYHSEAVAALRNSGVEHVLWTDSRIANWRQDATGLLLRSDTRITRDDMLACKTLSVIVKQGVGVDNVDVEAAKEFGIAVHNTPGMNSDAVAELSLALGFALARRITEFDLNLRNQLGKKRSELLGISLTGKTVGVIGMGNIGRLAAVKWIGGCNATLLAYDPFAPEDAWRDIPHRRVDIDELCSSADIITIHAPLTQSTRNLISMERLRSMKKQAILINTGRGGIIKESALKIVLTEGHLWGAALDALEVEPPSLSQHSDILDAGRVIITPHVGASTEDAQIDSGKMAVSSVLAVLKGQEAPGKVV